MPRKDDVVLSPPVGEYETIWASQGAGKEPLTCWSPIYAARQHELRNENGMLKPEDCHVIQVLIPSIGGLTWINVGAARIRLFPSNVVKLEGTKSEYNVRV